MLTPKLLEKYADVLIWGLETSRPSGYQPGDNVLVQFDLAGLKLAEALFAKLLARGINVIPRLGLTSRMELDFYSTASEAQLSFIAPGTRELFENLHGSVYILAPDSLTHLSGIDPKRIAQTAIARKPYRDILVRREEAGNFGWTLCVHPTDEYARCAGLTRKEFTEQVIKACHLRAADPVKEWKNIFDEAMEIKNWLNALPVESFHIESANVDLVVTPGLHRRFKGISGHNIPSFELFLSPDWRGTEGVYYADQPSYRNGNLVRGVRLVFRKGEVAEVSAEEGEEFVRKQVDMDGGSDKLGEFSLTDKRFSKIDKFMANTLFDENFGGEHGNCHVALGSSYSDTFDGDPSELTDARKAELGFNDSALHWDLVNTEKKRVTAKLRGGGSKLIYEDGQFAC
ncbi:aminopeptidase [Fundidesulfovibrio agrisoli]|uniref:aminopeptidase n=1 Tax=Fundidesulfovibrio agrisoli TaxID=2922717 RepID=UPI001FADDB4F